MTLFEICREIGVVEEGLMFGEIDFCYDSLMSAMKPGHPADILDDILSVIGWDVYAGKEPSIEKVREVHKRLNEYISCFKVKELKSAEKHLSEYLKEHDPEFQPKKSRAKKFVAESGREGYTIIRISQIEGKLVKREFRSAYDMMLDILGLPRTKYYFTWRIITDDAGNFMYAQARKVGGADCDGARGGEWYEDLRPREVSLIGNYIIDNCIE